MKIIDFEPNQPQSFVLAVFRPYSLPDGQGCLWLTTQGDLLHLSESLSESLALLNLTAGEQFIICCYQQKGRVMEWQVWLSPETEKARAAKEVAQLDLEAQLGASLKLVQGRRKSSGEGNPPYLAPTGTEGPVVSPTPLPVPAKGPALAATAGGGKRSLRPGPIPLNIAFREIVRFVVLELKDSGEQWSDQCRQDLVSTVMISAQKAGLLGVWEREGDAA